MGGHYSHLHTKPRYKRPRRTLRGSASVSSFVVQFCLWPPLIRSIIRICLSAPLNCVSCAPSNLSTAALCIVSSPTKCSSAMLNLQLSLSTAFRYAMPALFWLVQDLLSIRCSASPTLQGQCGMCDDHVDHIIWKLRSLPIRNAKCRGPKGASPAAPAARPAVR